MQTKANTTNIKMTALSDKEKRKKFHQHFFRERAIDRRELQNQKFSTIFIKSFFRETPAQLLLF
jgi:hypothetical protein